jgi:NAD(P) transhydrogenase subunit alpha
MIVGVPTETFPGERRVALTPHVLANLSKRSGIEVLLQSGAGDAAGIPDAEYREKGARIVDSRDAVFAEAEIVVQVRGFGTNPEQGKEDLARLRDGLVLVALQDPLGAPARASELAQRGATVFGLELIPRITRAQSMDVLSSQASIGGYKAAILAAEALPKIFPMMMTAAGTISPAHVFVIGAAVAGLQAIATARRLGAVVKAYDVRAAAREACESLGAKFVELPIEAGEAEGAGGYAKEQGEDFLRRQREMMLTVIAASDVVITTAAIPGRPAPKLVTREMVEAMAPGSVIVDLAAERGGNCELTRPGETVVHSGVRILGPVDLPSSVPLHASQMFAKNAATFLAQIVKDGQLTIDLEDEVVRETLVTRGGEVVHPRVREALDSASAA